MATTSLWRIKGRVERLLDYIEIPEKTVIHSPDPADEDASIRDVLEYVTRDSATDRSQLVSAINCSVKTAVKDMKETKQRFGKPGGTVAYHGYQCFAEGEVTPEQAHLLGCQLAEELWGDRYEVVIATHIDKASHIHNHFLINTVSFVDGIKFHRTKGDYLKMQEVFDRLCKEYNLSVVKHPVSEVSALNWFDEINVDEEMPKPDFITYGCWVKVLNEAEDKELIYHLPLKDDDTQNWYTIMKKMMGQSVGYRVFLAGKYYRVLEFGRDDFTS